MPIVDAAGQSEGDDFDEDDLIEELDRELADQPFDAVRAAIPNWINALLDLTGRNQLLYCKERGKIDLASADARARTALLRGGKVRISALFPDPTDQATALKAARSIRTKIREFEEERGVRVGRAISAFVSWTNTDPLGVKSTVNAPLLLRYITLTQTSVRAEDFELQLEPDVEVNELLLELAHRVHGVRVPEDLLADLEETGQEDFYPAASAARILELFPNEAGTTLTPGLLVGHFQYQKLPMVEDLEHNAEIYSGSTLVQAVAGDHDAMTRIRAVVGDVARDDPNHVEPADEFLVLDADPSQNFAINAAVAGRNIVIQGPPGTGKSQTIANLIAGGIARGKRILFVAEKRAAIDAVLSRLTSVGLDDAIFDLHDGATNKRRIIGELAGALARSRDTPRVDTQKLHNDLSRTRRQLLEHSQALHAVREPWGMSVFDAQCLALAVPPEAVNDAWIAGPALMAMTPEHLDACRQQMSALASAGGLVTGAQRNPWLSVTDLSASNAEARFLEAREFAFTLLPAIRALGVPAVRDLGLQEPQTLTAWTQVAGLLTEVNELSEVWSEEIWAADIDTWIAHTAPRSERSTMDAKPTWVERRRSRSAANALRRTPAKAAVLHQELLRITSLRRQWSDACASDSGTPRASATSEFAHATRAAHQALEGLGARLRRSDLGGLPLSDLEEFSRALASDVSHVTRAALALQSQAWLESQQLSPVLIEAEARAQDWPVERHAELAVGVLDWCVAQGILRSVTLSDPVIGGFDGSSHHQAARDFATSDRGHRDTTAARIRRLHAERVVQARNAYARQDTYLDVQLKRRNRIKPLRELLGEAPDVIMAAKPCWAMSPLVVSQALPATLKFDIVIFDEASQIRPADAIPSLGRAVQAVVCGDSKQLPPTSVGEENASLNTYADGDGSGDNSDEDDDEGVDDAMQGSQQSTASAQYGDLASDAESLLDVFESALGASLANEYRLLWHYRSRDARLIDFSNAYFYDNSLLTFPGTVQDTPVQFLDVETTLGRQARVEDEVECVIDTVMEHARQHPGHSLGVIALGSNHANRLQGALQARLRTPEGMRLASFFDDTRTEPFFIKNLERVQGDERDRIIITPGYVKNDTGRLPLRFGTLNNAGGERRINVAVSRAKEQVLVVSSFTHADLDPTKVKNDGSKVLGAYLAYAASGGTNLGDQGASLEPLNAFEIHVRDRLVAAGIPVIAQYGVGQFRIDFVAQHPQRPGQMVLAIEADGARYHSSETARARDRLRQEHLERLGWRFCRIWSTDYFRDPDAEIARVKAAYEAAVAAFGREPDELPEPEEDPLLDPLVEMPQERLWAMPLIPGFPIDHYTDRDLAQLIAWVESDQRLRTEQELIDECFLALGYKRRGSKIIARLGQAVRRANRAKSKAEGS